MTRISKDAFKDSPAFAANVAQLQSLTTSPYQRQQAAEAVYASCYPYVAQQGEIYAGKAAALGIERGDLEQAAALKLWRFVIRPAGEKIVSPQVFAREAKKAVRTEMTEICEAGSGDVICENKAGKRVAADRAWVAKTNAHGFLTHRAEQEVAAGLRVVGYEQTARKPAKRLDDVAAYKPAIFDEDGIMDGVFDTPARGAAELMAAPGYSVEGEVDARRQRELFTGFARDMLPSEQFSVISKRYGLEDPLNKEMNLPEVAASEGITVEAARRLESKAMTRLKAHFDRNPGMRQAALMTLAST